MYFFLKEYAASFFTPTPFIGTLLLIGTIALILKKNWAKFPFYGAFALFILFGTDPLPEYLLNSVEMKYPAFKASEHKDIKFVTVLAGGLAPYDGHPVSTQLTPSTLTRLIEGIKIYREFPGSKLIVTGKGWSLVTEASLMKEMAIKLGVPPEQIITEEESRNTYEHTVYLKKVIGESKFVLVTSALHLPRAMRLFEAAGYKPVPAPAQHILTGKYKPMHFRVPFPTGDNLKAMDDWFIEFLSTKYVELKGHI